VAGPGIADGTRRCTSLRCCGNETILIVDDEESIRAINKRILEKAGYKVLLASDGAEALMVFTQRREEIDVIITDIMMPVMDGNTLARVLMKTAPSLKLITCSGLDNTKLSSPPFSNPLASLKKPVSQRILLQAIRHSIDGTSPENVRIGAQLSEEQLNQPAKLAGATN